MVYRAANAQQPLTVANDKFTMPEAALPPEIAGALPEGVQIPKPLNPDDDPNLKLQQIVSRRGASKAPEEPKKEEPKKEEPKAPVDNTNLGSIIGKALGFREEKPKADSKKDELPKDEKVEPKAEDKKEEPPKKEEPKTIVAKKKPAAPVADPVQIATAAATAAVKAIQTPTKPLIDTAAKFEDTLKEEDRHEYEVAKYLSEHNPKFKNAPKIVLDHIKKAEAYADKWESENKGKVFDPNDDDHNEFFTALEKPWSDHEFRTAETHIAAEKIIAEREQKQANKIKELELENATVAITPVIERTITAVAGVLAKEVGEDTHKKIVEHGFDKFSEEEPITADILAATVNSLHPLIEVAIQLDDPKGRFAFNENNKTHQEWNRIILNKEKKFAGTEDGHGRTMVSRSQYARMPEAQRADHWYITTELLIEEIVRDAAEKAKKDIHSQKEQVKKFALSMGFVPKDEATPKSPASGTPKKETAPKAPSETSQPAKPASPSAGAGAKIDDKSAGSASGTKKTLEATAGILFNR